MIGDDSKDIEYRVVVNHEAQYSTWHPELDASELDFYLFNREARMDGTWESERDAAEG